MATRGHYIFDNKTIIYNHWDNYPEGAAILLNRMLLQDSPHNTDLAGRFMRANPNAELTGGEMWGGAEFNYYIDTDTKIIHVKTVEWDDKTDTETEKPFFDGTIYDFINEYYPQSADIKNEREYKQDTKIKLNTWKDGESLESLKQRLKNEIDSFTEYMTLTADNPNKNDRTIQEILETMKKFF